MFANVGCLRVVGVLKVEREKSAKRLSLPELGMGQNYGTFSKQIFMKKEFWAYISDSDNCVGHKLALN